MLAVIGLLSSLTPSPLNLPTHHIMTIHQALPLIIADLSLTNSNDNNRQYYNTNINFNM